MPRTAALDGWDDFFSYYISNTPPAAPTLNQDWTLTNNFHEGNTGAITVTDRVTPTPNVVAVIVSYGKNGQGAYTIKGTRNQIPLAATQPDENQNAALTVPLTFYKREYTDNVIDAVNNPGGPFDDVVMALGTNELLTPLIKDGVMQSALGVYINQAAKIQDYIASQIVQIGCPVPPGTVPGTPPGLPANLTIDPWGNTLNAGGSPFTYTRNIVAPFTFSSSANAGSTVFTLSNNTLSNGIPILPPTYQSIAPFGSNLSSAYKYLQTSCP